MRFYSTPIYGSKNKRFNNDMEDNVHKISHSQPHFSDFDYVQ